MAVLSRVSYGAIELLQVDSNPNGTSALVNSLAVLTTDNSVYKNIDGGTTWILFSGNASATTDKNFATLRTNFLGGVYKESGAIGAEFGSGITTTTPIDDTIPQYSEGSVILTTPLYTVKSSTSKIRVAIVVHASTNTIASYTIHTHRSTNGGSYAGDAEAATYVACMINTATMPANLSYSIDSPGVGSTIQYKVVAGPNAGTLTINGISGARYYGGKYLSTIQVQEIEQ